MLPELFMQCHFPSFASKSTPTSCNQILYWRMIHFWTDESGLMSVFHNIGISLSLNTPFWNTLVKRTQSKATFFHGLLRQLLHSGLYGKKLSILCVSRLSNPLVGRIGLSYTSMGICIFEYVSLISIPHSSWHARLHKCWSKLSKNNKNHGFFFCFSF